MNGIKDSREMDIIKSITRALAKDSRVIFAYLYGSMVVEGQGNDIDIAIYADEQVNPHLLSADLKILLHEDTGLSPDTFDIRVINGLLRNGDIFTLLYLKSVLTNSRLLFSRDPEVQSDFLERYGLKYRGCEGLIQELTHENRPDPH